MVSVNVPKSFTNNLINKHFFACPTLEISTTKKVITSPSPSQTQLIRAYVAKRYLTLKATQADEGLKYLQWNVTYNSLG